jgi:hypothetical protein
VRFEVGNGSRVLFWQNVWCGKLPLKNVFPTLFTIAYAKEAWLEENMAIVNGVVHSNVKFIRPVSNVPSLCSLYWGVRWHFIDVG